MVWDCGLRLETQRRNAEYFSEYDFENVTPCHTTPLLFHYSPAIAATTLESTDYKREARQEQSRG